LSALEQGSVQALHRTRVASRRLREIVPLMTLDRPTALKLKRRLREVTRTLGEVRELDVLALLIDDLRRNVRYRPVGLDTLEAAVSRARWTARQQLAEALPPSRLRRLAERLEWAHKSVQANRPGSPSKVNRPDGAWIWALEARMTQRAARVRRTIDVAGTIYVPARLHDVRVALKKVRYATELLQEAGLMRQAGDLHTLKATQDLLGRMHDFDVLIAWGRDALASLPVADADTRRELNLLLLGLEDDCRRMHGRYMRSRAALIGVVDRLQAAARESTPLQGPTVAAPRQRARSGGRRSPTDY
jgi:CHAD domain-containing protein